FRRVLFRSANSANRQEGAPAAPSRKGRRCCRRCYCVLWMDFPNTAAKARDAQEGGIWRHVDVVHLHKGKAGAKAAPVRAAIGGAIYAKEGGREHSVLVQRADHEPGDRNVGQASAGVDKGQATIG